MAVNSDFGTIHHTFPAARSCSKLCGVDVVNRHDFLLCAIPQGSRISKQEGCPRRQRPPGVSPRRPTFGVHAALVAVAGNHAIQARTIWAGVGHRPKAAFHAFCSSRARTRVDSHTSTSASKEIAFLYFSFLFFSLWCFLPRKRWFTP